MYTDLVKEVDKFLKSFKFQQSGSVWQLVQKGPDQHMTVQIGGQVQQVVQPGQTHTFWVEYNQAQVGQDEAIQTLFRVSSEGTILMEYEEVFTDFSTFAEIFTEVF